MYLIWETPVDFRMFDNVFRFDCGDDRDIHPGLSSVSANLPIKAVDYNEQPVLIDIHAKEITPTGCMITGASTNPFGIAERYTRFDIFNDTLEKHHSYYTNSTGSFFFFGTVGQRMKLKFENDRNVYWFMVPDKVTITLDEVMSTYGYRTQENTFTVSSPYAESGIIHI